jgi:UDP-N-acetylglucosamine 2-epimerase
MKIIHIVGARPQFVKLAPLYKEIQNKAEQLIIHTGQHYDEKMSKIFFEDLAIPKPDYNLNINQGSHAYQTAEMMKGIEKILLDVKECVLVIYGDTNSTLAGALAASKLEIPIVHIEAGLRSFNRSMPEEVNRILADRISNYLLAPTQTAVSNLNKEGLADVTYFTGDIMTDSIRQNIIIAHDKSDVLEKLNQTNNNYYLLTLHRPYNVDNPEKLVKILSLLNDLNKEVLFPIHPRTRKILEANLTINLSNIRLIEPQGYLDFLILQENAIKIITDSGGIQKEACILKRPCITLRSETEWVETVKEGVNLLVTRIEEGLTQKIMSFNPVFPSYGIFGEKVSEKMCGIITDILRKDNAN